MKQLISLLLALMMVFTILPVGALAATTVVESGTCGENLTWTLDSEGTLTISGTGPMEEYIFQDEIEGEICNIIVEAPWSADAVTKVLIGEGVTSIGSAAFFYCSNMLTVVIPSSVTSIGDSAFYCCDSLTSITIPDSVTSIGNAAFYCCDSLTSITIPDGVTSIGDFTFDNCSSLAIVNVPNSVTSIGAYAFYDCSSLGSITIPDSVTSIGESAFYDCSSLGSITIPDGVTSIGALAFRDCDSLTSITIPDSVAFIGACAFASCNSLTEIRVDEDNQYYCSDESGVLFDKEKTILLQAPGVISGTYVMPESLTAIGQDAFFACKDLKETVIPEGVLSIGEYAFVQTGLSNLLLPNGLIRIGDGAFWYCSSLTSITIPDSVTYIGNYAFSRTGLTQIYFEGDAPEMDVAEYYEEDEWISYYGGSFEAVTATAYYPADNATWTEEVLTANYGGNLTWVPYTPIEEVPGDLDGDEVVDSADVAQLLWYVLFPDTYGVQGTADVNGDGYENTEDVTYLLWHTLFPELYPLAA